MKSIIHATIAAVSITGCSLANAANVPFPEALEDASVSLSSMSDGQGESLMLGNGDLYGIVWEKDGGLFMRITKNDIWDARVDTSHDGPVPKVDVATGKLSGSTGAPPSYGKPYPQPRCATGLWLGRIAPVGALTWRCIRGATKHALTPAEARSEAVMEVEGAALESTGYQVRLPGGPVATSFHMSVKGTENAEYYVDIFDRAGKVIFKSGWTKSPAAEKQIEFALTPDPIGAIILYARTLDGKMAQNRIGSVYLLNGDKKTPLTFDRPPSLQGHLDIRKAVASIATAESVTRVRVLHGSNVVLIDSPDPVVLDPIKSATLPDAKLGETDGVSWLSMNMPGDVDYRGMDYAVAVAAKGNLKAVSLVTSFDVEAGDVLPRAIALARHTLQRDKAALIASHEQAWEAYWSRSGVDLADRDLQRWWYRMLYFAKTVCKPGAAPVALMPPLATDVTPWHADYHHNYNAWQAFWPLPAANQSELADPWISYIHEMLPRFKWLAKDRYGIEGACCPISSFLHEPDPAVCRSKNNRQVVMNPWGLTIGMAGMTIQSMWQKHLCDPDPEYLKAKIYPTLREGARFYVGFMERCTKDGQGKVLLGPSYSPEHGPVGIHNCPFDIAYVHYTFDAFIQAADELNTDEDLAAQCRTYKALLGDYPTALDAGGKPVVVDWQGCRYKAVGQHNIEVPATPVFPGDQVTWFSPEAEKELFRRTIRDTPRTGDNSHVMFNIAKARLSMPEAVTDAKAWFLPRQLPNGFIRFPWAHGTFMQEMIGLAGLVNELLLQSVENKIRVFPCWPQDKDAKFSGLRAQGGFVVSAEQKGGQVVRLEIESTVGGKLQLVSPWKTITADGKVLQQNGQGLVSLDTRKGETLIFKGR
jgi:hypothetical protein